MRNVYKELGYYIKVEDFEKYRFKFEEMFSTLEHKQKEFVEKIKVDHDLKLLKQDILKELEQYSLSKECRKETLEIQRYQQRLKDDMEDLRKISKRYENEFIIHKKMILTKVEQQEFDSLKERSLTLAEKKELQDL